MLKGHTFNLQTFTSDAFALFIDKFLDGRCGVARGCSLSNTNNSVTISEGYFVIKGRFLQIISNETLSNIITDGYYSLICEIDLSKTNTTEELNQAEIKTIYNSSSYPTLTQQDITDTGTKYQYEFARFKVENGNISDFTDRRTFVDFSTIYEIIENESQELIDEIQEALQDVLDGSIYFLKDDIAILNSEITINTNTQEGSAYVNLPTGWTAGNTKILNIWCDSDGTYWKSGTAVFGFSFDYGLSSRTYIRVFTVKLSGSTSFSPTSNIKVLVMKI